MRLTGLDQSQSLVSFVTAGHRIAVLVCLKHAAQHHRKRESLHHVTGCKALYRHLSNGQARPAARGFSMRLDQPCEHRVHSFVILFLMKSDTI
jgi:hypothetical protein